MGLRALFLPLLLVPLLLAPAEAQQAVFPDVKVRFSRGKDRLLVEKGADLVFNDAARRLQIKSGDRPLDVAYDQVTKVVLERSLRGTDRGWRSPSAGWWARPSMTTPGWRRGRTWRARASRRCCC